jgi:hypothetical protein
VLLSIDFFAGSAHWFLNEDIKIKVSNSFWESLHKSVLPKRFGEVNKHASTSPNYAIYFNLKVQIVVFCAHPHLAN